MDNQIIFCNIENNVIEKSWQITISDDEDNVINICRNMGEFYKTMEELGDRNLIEVHWSKDNDVIDEHFNEIRQYMDSFQNELENKENSDREIL